MKRATLVPGVLRWFPGSSQESLADVPGRGGIVAVMDINNGSPGSGRSPARGGRGSTHWYLGAAAALLAVGIFGGVALAGNAGAPASQTAATGSASPAGTPNQPGPANPASRGGGGNGGAGGGGGGAGGGGGSGLGLSIVQAIALAHGGQAALESWPGRGTRVRIWLPARNTP